MTYACIYRHSVLLSIGGSLPTADVISTLDIELVKIDYSKASKLVEERSEHAKQRLERWSRRLTTSGEQARNSSTSGSIRVVGCRSWNRQSRRWITMGKLKRLLALARKERDRLREIRQVELDKAIDFFDRHVKGALN